MLSSRLVSRVGHLNRPLSACQSLRAFCSSVDKKQQRQEELLNTPLSKKVDKSKYKVDDEDEDEKPKPVPYTTSKAFSYKTAETFRTPNEGPPSQYYFVTISVALFLVYFIFLREENDLDEKLYTPWAGNEQILKTILLVQQKKTTDPEEVTKINERIAELDQAIKESASNS